ncbi:hypothetical protein SAMN04488058_108108 [Deinococcus reticulitermitis]|uniref:Uncharacterized protein n=1 Tax=Deinococcus reticulitermitis TaxID=856736 RepID=A0A1H6Z9F9_9DEIO|nr:hypothetical protein [Deinococcus reticulitermitis]SEJ45515.1 hypothetical protein SAMN04488058_108108 [Deinococcus reticulitermitis]
MKLPPLAWTVALVTALLWLGIGVVQRTGRGAAFGDAVVSELPTTALVFVFALVLFTLRRR